MKEKILRLIEETGPLPFEEFMRLALYDPQGGFFTTGPLRSAKEGDFLTSPEVSPLFGETLAVLVQAERERLGRPDGFAVVEAGAGSGSLLRPLLAALDDPVEAWAIEVSPAAREALGGMLGPDRVVGSLAELPGGLEGAILANELLDNFPAAVALRTRDGWAERWVGADGDRLVAVTVPARSEVAAWAGRFGGRVREGGIVEVQLEAGSWLEEALGLIRRGAVVVIDYGDTGEGLASRREAGTLRTYRGHHLGPDLLEQPGRVDITMDVDFSALAATAEAAGAEVELLRQEELLTRLGFRDRLAELRREELRLAREGRAMERLAVRSQVTDGETLLHPRGLGDFRALIARR